MMEKEDMINHPNHYKSESGLEVIDVIEAFTKGLDAFEGYCTGNIIKYACRWNNKGGAEDIKKLMKYGEFLVAYEESKMENQYKNYYNNINE